MIRKTSKFQKLSIKAVVKTLKESTVDSNFGIGGLSEI